MFSQYYEQRNSVSFDKLINFDKVLMPTIPTCYKGVYELLMDMNPMHIDTSASLLEVISDLPFADKLNTESIFTQFKSLALCYGLFG